MGTQSSMQIILHGRETGKIGQGNMQHHMVLLLLVSKFTYLEFKYLHWIVQFMYIVHIRLNI